MLTALTEDKSLISLVDEIPPAQIFRCPACYSRLRLKKGKIVRPHFAHLSAKNCSFASENESIEHLSLKAKLYSSLVRSEKVEIEKFLPAIQQIADLLVNDSLVLEIQCSSLSIERLKERTQAYKDKHLQVRWLLGEKLWLKKKLKELQKQLLNFSWQIGFHLWELDLAKNEIRLKYLIHENLFGEVTYLCQAVSLDDNLSSFFSLPYQKLEGKQVTCQTDQKLLSKIKKALQRKDKKWLSYQEKLYLQGDNLLNHSLDFYFPQIQPVKSSIGFCQIEANLNLYYLSFKKYYKKLSNKTSQTLYPPFFYVKIWENRF
ncbi:competence protein CoiA [Streptococcus didelphis]|uniref:competence protein CoiA n=1 Tax=Streptococcus didelphis TaxID=102886 RepID=UPI0003710050|nr:competence protein CoiA family protein [Streptococcus didelphis]